MKRWYFFSLLCFPGTIIAQINAVPLDRNGLVNIFSNPASLQLNDQVKWSVNILSFNTWASSNTASLSLTKLFSHDDLLREHILGTTKISSGFAGLDIKGPSLGIRINQNTNIAFSTRSRTFAAFSDLDGRVVSEIGETVKKEHEYPYSLVSSKDMLINAAVFNDFSATLSRVFWTNRSHRIRGGVSLKYISGVAQSSIEVSDLQGIISLNKNAVSYLSDASGTVSTRTSGHLLGDIGFNNFVKFSKGSLGADFGLVYDFFNGLEKSPKFSIMISLTDVGKIRFQPDTLYSKSYNVKIPLNKGLFFNNNFRNSSFSNTTEIFEKYPEFFKQTSSETEGYKIGMPTMLRFKINYCFDESFGAIADLAFNMQNNDKISNLHNPSYVSLSPSWHKNLLSIYLPISYQKYAVFNVGIGLKYKEFFIGSNSLISAIVGARQIDAYVGLLLIKK